MPTAPADNGPLNPSFGDATFNSISTSSITGNGIGGGTFTCDADASTSVTDAGIKSTSQIIIFPTNMAAGLLLRSKTCSTDVGAGSFTFQISATGSGAPAGTETFDYIFINES